MDNNSSILGHGLVSGSTIDIVIRMTENTTIPEDVEYSSFVQSVSPPDGVLVTQMSYNFSLFSNFIYLNLSITIQ